MTTVGERGGRQQDGPLAGLRVVELASEMGAFAGKLMADMGADVISIEPPAGHPTRAFSPFAGDEPDPERSLWFWHYHTSKQGITLDVDQTEGRALFRRLVESADILLESEPPGRMAALELDYTDLTAGNPRLVYVSITPFGRSAPRAEEQATDLTLIAGGGPAWSCGYDDHTLPPVRGGGNQGYQTACHFAVMSAMVALLAREHSGRGQHIDVNAHAANNVTTEAASYTWLVARDTVQRQTGRHASVNMSMPSQVRCADGRYANTGVPARNPQQFRAIYEWLKSLGLLEQFEEAPLLEVAMEGPPLSLAALMGDEEARAKFAAARNALNFLAERLTAYEFFVGGQERGFQLSIINSPEESLDDRHMAARGFPVEVAHPEEGRFYRYPGAPYRFTRTPWRIRRRAPLLGQDNEDVYAGLGIGPEELAALRERGVV